MDESPGLANYLPLSYQTSTEQEYINFIWDAFEMNYTHGKYQSSIRSSSTPPRFVNDA